MSLGVDFASNRAVWYLPVRWPPVNLAKMQANSLPFRALPELEIGSGWSCSVWSELRAALAGIRPPRWSLAILGCASFLTPVTYWAFDKSSGQLTLKSCSGLLQLRDGPNFPLSDVISVVLAISSDNEGGRSYNVRLVLRAGRQLDVSDHKLDADRIAEFLGVEKSIRNS